MKARIAPTPVGVRKSRLNRLGAAESVVRAPFPAASLPSTGMDDVTKRSSVPIASRETTAVTRTCPPILRAASVPGIRNEPGNSPTETTSVASGSLRTFSSSALSLSSSAAEAWLAFARASSFARRSSRARIVSSCFAICAFSSSISEEDFEEEEEDFLEGVLFGASVCAGEASCAGGAARDSSFEEVSFSWARARPPEKATNATMRSAKRLTSPAARSRASPCASAACCGSSRVARPRCLVPRSSIRSRRGP